MLRLENSPAVEYSFLRAEKTQCFSSVEEWVARHSTENVQPENFGEEHQTEDPGLEYSSSLALMQDAGQECGTQQPNSLKRSMTLSEVYLIAQATRRAREKENAEENGGQSRSSMLRKAYAVQREFTASLQSEFSMNSAETKSSVEWLLNCRETDPEQLLLNLGFGGPTQGVDRIPKRFLQPSKLQGVEIETFFKLQEELADVFETGSLGYRGLSGPPTRRPSMIVSRILEKMREQQKEELKRKFSAPPLSAPLPYQPITHLPPAPEQACPVIEEHKEELQDTVVDTGIAALEHRNSIKPQSTLSSRRSSLRKQDHVEEWDDDEKFTEAYVEQTAVSCANSSSSGFYDNNIQRQPSQDSPHDSLLHQGRNASFCDDDVSCTEESAGAVASQTRNINPVLAILRVAVQTYKSQLQQRFPVQRRVYDPTDCNHNSIRSDPPDLVALQEEIRRELQRTEVLLDRCQLQMDAESLADDVTVSAVLSELARDMAALLERQQLLNLQLHETWPVQGRETGPEVENKFSSRGRTMKLRRAAKRPPEILRPWLQSFERKLCSLVRSAVRKELRRALTAESLGTSAASSPTT